MLQSRIRRHLRHGTLPQLATFDAVARLGSVTLAASAMHMAQPTVSIQIRKLSETLGVDLFEQVGRRLQLTPAGEVVQHCCERLFEQFVRLDEALSSLRRVEAGHLRLACPNAFAPQASVLLSRFVARHPGVEASLFVGNRAVLLERMAGNEDDLYLMSSLAHDDAVVRQTLVSNPHVIVAASGNPLTKRALTLDQLASQPFVMREPGSGTRGLADRLLADAGIEPPIALVLPTHESVREAVAAGAGVALLPVAAIAGAAGVTALDVVGLPIDRPWQIAYAVGHQVSTTARAFLDFVRIASIDGTLSGPGEGTPPTGGDFADTAPAAISG